ncbi:MAG: uracil-DNA glycosylase [Rhodoferax sp.]|nr:uracil-DNA glycosylase [Rhodoferax sp.]
MQVQKGLQGNFGLDFWSGQSAQDAVSVGDRLQAWEPSRWAVAPDWQGLVDGFLDSAEGQALGCFLAHRLSAGAHIQPPEPLRALALTALADTRVVLVGQDPYHGPGQAEGLAFSVRPGVPLPPSLRNIFRELARDPELATRGPSIPRDGSLMAWAQQGVLLLNTCLTVEEGQPGSHAGRGWEVLTHRLIDAIAARARPVVFLLWGAHAQSLRPVIAAGDPNGRHLVLVANHPSPLSASRPPRPFLGCGHFSQANRFLTLHHLPVVNW